ncbi:MAG: transglutaminase domain-containing protein [Anaerolineales bacterium]
MSRKRLFQLSMIVLFIALLLTGCNKFSGGFFETGGGKPDQATSLTEQLHDQATPQVSPTAPPAEARIPDPTYTPALQNKDIPEADHNDSPEGEKAPEPTSPASKEAVANQPQTRTYNIQQTFDIRNESTAATNSFELIVAKIRSLEPFQEVTDFSVEPELEYHEKSDEHGNQYLILTIKDLPVKEKIRITLNYQVNVHAQKTNNQECEGDLITDYTQAEAFIESGSPEIIGLAEKLSRDKTDLCQQSRAFYKYVTGAIAYSGHNNEPGGAVYTLSQKSGDCTEFSDLLIALNRSAGIPARFVEGVTPLEDDETHDWVQVYLPGSGWTTMDPTWGRKPDQRETYFAGTTPDHIIVTTGRNLEALNYFHYWTYKFTCPKNAGQPDVDISMNWDIQSE